MDPNPAKVADPNCAHTDLEYLARLRLTTNMTPEEEAMTLTMENLLMADAIKERNDPDDAVRVGPVK